MVSAGTVHPDKASVADSFSRAASTYDLHARHHEVIASILAGLFAGLPQPGKILEIGCGTGIMTGKILRAFPGIAVHALDISPGMIEACRSKFRGNRALSVMPGDAEEYLEKSPGYDMVVSSCSFQWLHDTGKIARRVANSLVSGGSVVLAVPVEGTLFELAESFRTGAGRIICSLEMDTGETWMKRFVEAGFDVVEAFTRKVTVSFPDPIDVLKSVRGIGASLGREGSGIGPHEVAAMRRYYRNVFSSPRGGGVDSSYRVFFISCITGRNR